MDNNEHKGHDDGSTCMMCRLHHAMHSKNACSTCFGMNHYAVIRILLGLGILALVFWMGVEVGGMIGENGGYGRDGGMGEGGYGGGGGRHPMMMYDNNGYSDQYYGGGNGAEYTPSRMENSNTPVEPVQKTK